MKKNKLTPHLDLAAVNREKYPWPYKDNSVEEVACTHILHMIPGKARGKFMDEIYRVLIPEGRAVFTIPHWSSMRATADFATEWPPISEMSFCFFNKKQREEAKVHPELHCDFEIVGYGCSEDVDTATREQSVKDHWKKHFLNAVLDLQMHLVKKVR